MKHTDIFDHTSDLDTRPTRILLEGITGSGKSVLADKIAYDWALEIKKRNTEEILATDSTEEKYVKKFKLAFLFKNIDTECKNLETLIFDKSDIFPKDFDSSKTKVLDVAHSMETEVLFIIDIGETNLCQLMESAGQSVVIDLIQGNIFRKSTVLVTSRPQIARAMYPSFHVFLHNNGFDPMEGPKRFIKNYSKVTKSEESWYHPLELKIMQNDPVISDLAKIPLFCLLLCLSYHDRYDDTGVDGDVKRFGSGREEESITTLLGNLVEDFRKHSSSDTNATDSTVSFQKLCEQAIGCLARNQNFISVQDVDLGIINLGFLAQSHVGSLRKKSKVYQFPHHSIVEFLAAVHVRDQVISQENTHQYLETLLKSPADHGLFWVLLSGLLGMMLPSAQASIEKVLKSVTDFLIPKCVQKESGSPSAVAISPAESFEMFKLLFECIYEMAYCADPKQLKCVISCVADALPHDLTYNTMPCRQTCFLGLAMVIKAGGQNLRCLYIDLSFIDGNKCLEKLAESVKNNEYIETIQIKWQHFPKLQHFLSHLVNQSRKWKFMSFVCKGASHVDFDHQSPMFYPEGEQIVDDEMSWSKCHNPELTGHFLTSVRKCVKIKKLRITHCLLTQKVVSDMKLALKNRTLQKLVLDCCQVLDSETICKTPEPKSGKSLDKTLVDDKVATCLEPLFSNCKFLVELGLDACRLGDNGVTKVMQSLTSVQFLYLRANNISRTGARMICKAIQENKHCRLKVLALDDNMIDDSGATDICKTAMLANVDLEVVSLARNRVSLNDVEGLQFTLGHHATLKSLNLCENKITTRNADKVVLALVHLMRELVDTRHSERAQYAVQIMCSTTVCGKAAELIYEIQNNKMLLQHSPQASTSSSYEDYRDSVSRIVLQCITQRLPTSSPGTDTAFDVIREIILDGNSIKTVDLVQKLGEEIPRVQPLRRSHTSANFMPKTNSQSSLKYMY